MDQAYLEFERLEPSDPAYGALKGFLKQSREELQAGSMAEKVAVMTSGNEIIKALEGMVVAGDIEKVPKKPGQQGGRATEVYKIV